MLACGEAEGLGGVLELEGEGFGVLGVGFFGVQGAFFTGAGVEEERGGGREGVGLDFGAC